ncbi:MAG TPA: hypothetical protein VGL83_06495 [Stellaceae bacterium]|jgi:hypothetical protein
MKEYRCYFINRRGGIGDMVAFVSADDIAALAEGRAYFARQSDYRGYEIWERARLVHRDTAGKQSVPV